MATKKAVTIRVGVSGQDQAAGKIVATGEALKKAIREVETEARIMTRIMAEETRQSELTAKATAAEARAKSELAKVTLTLAKELEVASRVSLNEARTRTATATAIMRESQLVRTSEAEKSASVRSGVQLRTNQIRYEATMRTKSAADRIADIDREMTAETGYTNRYVQLSALRQRAIREEVMAQRSTEAARVSGLGRAASALTGIGGGASTVGRGLTHNITAPIAIAGAVSELAAVSRETSLADVHKVFSDATTADMVRINKQLVDLSHNLPLTYKELANLANFGGQLGVPIDKLQGFVKVTAQLGMATDLTGEQAANGLAKIAAAYHVTDKDFTKFFADAGNALAAMSQAGAAHTSEILDASERFASAGKQAKMSVPDILALSNAILSSGQEAEAAGSAVLGLIGKIETGIGTGNKQLKQFANVAGMTTAQFARSFKEDAFGAIMSYVQGLARMSEAGHSSIATLKEMGITNIRQEQTVISLSEAFDKAAGYRKLASDAVRDGTKLDQTSGIVVATTASKWKIFANQLEETAAAAGNELKPEIDKLLPTFTAIVHDVEGLIHNFNQLSEGEKRLAFEAVIAVAALGPLATALGSVATGAGAVLRGYAAIVKWDMARAMAATATKTATVATELDAVATASGPAAKGLAGVATTLGTTFAAGTLGAMILRGSAIAGLAAFDTYMVSKDIGDYKGLYDDIGSANARTASNQMGMRTNPLANVHMKKAAAIRNSSQYTDLQDQIEDQSSRIDGLKVSRKGLDRGVSPALINNEIAVSEQSIKESRARLAVLEARAKAEDVLSRAVGKSALFVSESTFGGSQPVTVAEGHKLAGMFGFTDIGGKRATAIDKEGHPQGLALDFMTHGDDAKGKALAEYTAAHMKEENVKYIIWQQHIISQARIKEGWRKMGDRGSATANHMDHVHMTFNAGSPSTVTSSAARKVSLIPHDPSLFNTADPAALDAALAKVQSAENSAAGSWDAYQDALNNAKRYPASADTYYNVAAAALDQWQTLKRAEIAAKLAANGAKKTPTPGKARATGSREEADLARTMKTERKNLSDLRNGTPEEQFAGTQGIKIALNSLAEQHAGFVVETLNRAYDRTGDASILPKLGAAMKKQSDLKVTGISLAAELEAHPLSDTDKKQEIALKTKAEKRSETHDLEIKTLALDDKKQEGMAKARQLDKDNQGLKIQSLQLDIQSAKNEDEKLKTMGDMHKARLQEIEDQHEIDSLSIDPATKANADKRYTAAVKDETAQYSLDKIAVSDHELQAKAEGLKFMADNADTLAEKLQLVTEYWVALLSQKGLTDDQRKMMGMQSTKDTGDLQRRLTDSNAQQAIAEAIGTHNSAGINGGLGQLFGLAISGSDSERTQGRGEYVSTVQKLADQKLLDIKTAISMLKTMRGYETSMGEINTTDQAIKSLQGTDRRNQAREFGQRFIAEMTAAASSESGNFVNALLHGKNGKAAMKSFGKALVDSLENSIAGSTSKGINDMLTNAFRGNLGDLFHTKRSKSGQPVLTPYTPPDPLAPYANQAANAAGDATMNVIGAASSALDTAQATIKTAPSAFKASRGAMMEGAGAIMAAAAALATAGNGKKQKHSMIGGLLGLVAGAFIGAATDGIGLAAGASLGMGAGSLIGGMFAEGGTAPAGKMSLTGERGPELAMTPHGPMIVGLHGPQLILPSTPTPIIPLRATALGSPSGAMRPPSVGGSVPTGSSAGAQGGLHAAIEQLATAMARPSGGVNIVQHIGSIDSQVEMDQSNKMLGKLVEGVIREPVPAY